MMDRRNDIGQKMFIGIVTAILTTIFVGALGLGIRAYEKDGIHDIEIALLKQTMINQDRLNLSQDRLNQRVMNLLENKERLMGFHRPLNREERKDDRSNQRIPGMGNLQTRVASS